MTDEHNPKEWDLGWYPDPERPGEERFWNGAEWTQRRRASAMPTTDERTYTQSRTTLWLVVGGLALVAVVAIVVLVVLIDRSDSIVEDDDAEFREVSITACEPPGAFDEQQVRGRADNGSSERSDYRIEVEVLASDGTRIGTGSTDVRDVEPGQAAVWTIDTDTADQDWDAGSTCEVSSVERTASL